MASMAGSSITMQPRNTLASRSVSGLKLGSFMKQGGRSLSFTMRPMPARLQISCAAKKETLDKVCEVVRKQLAVEDDKPITGESTFLDLGADSLDTVEIVMGLEEEFGITVEEDNAQSITTVQDAADLIEELCSKKSA
ncbi:Acyl carrier protein 2 [Hibiscus syriacus]|uniref:Acyl carrier protein n=1 Tax=Hibiscus syriacus TaxID=106335 RepID=A0A6A2XRV4_HIBSY|nr:acyl carrier protein 1, chloroplastic-like [Hibiscus syriacus]XP_039043846.1 acyl carrier protein 1, chloroplastic-like [Hibiscus syriacus]KAE8664716.1 Acyl carrier protein 2 [Hibiscus syriacus]